MPVGRLDYMTEGLLLLTNDGELKRQLELPKHRRRPPLPGAGVRRRHPGPARGLSEGVTIDGIRYGSIDANLERRTGRNCWIELSLTEGKNREVRNVLAASRPAGLAADPHQLRPVLGEGMGRATSARSSANSCSASAKP
jgi:23S rRNA pseudouridine2605 synthase